jgi:hypothetical protein
MSLLTLFNTDVFPSASVTEYLNLITSEHRVRPNFVALISALVQGPADIVQAALSLPGKFDVQAGVGDQLNKTGQWIGATRYLSLTAAAQAGTTQLDDVHFSQYLQGLAYLNNLWIGSIPSAYQAYATWWSNHVGAQPVIQDNGNLTMHIGQAGFVMDAQEKALFNNGYLDARPAGITVKAHVAATAAAPLFGFHPAGSSPGPGLAGLGTGCWGTFSPPS